MVAGGNQKAREFFKTHGHAESTAENPREKFVSRAAKLYRLQLEKDIRLIVLSLNCSPIVFVGGFSMMTIPLLSKDMHIKHFKK